METKKETKKETQVTSQINRIFDIFKTSDGEIRPHFILTGPSGSGKTFTIETLCEDNKIPMFEINAAQLTKEGTSGNSLSKALGPLKTYGGKPCVCFVDEWDKLFLSGNSNSDLAHETTTGVQNEFLKVLESNKTSVFGDYGKYIDVDTSKVLFVFAGAFNNQEEISVDDLRHIGVKTEFLGRVGLIYNTTPMSLDLLLELLGESKLLLNYCVLFNLNKSEVVEAIKPFVISNYEKNTIGARILSTLIHQYFIKGGKLNDNVVKQVTFQKSLTL